MRQEDNMVYTLSATEARIHFGEVMRNARLGPVIVERDGKPEVVVISKDAYDALVAASTSSKALLQAAHRQVREDLAGYTGGAQPRHLPDPEDVLAELRGERHGD
jgi:prevent-host-death family protein